MMGLSRSACRRFSLRSLLSVIFLLGLFLGAKSRQAKTQQAAVAQLTSRDCAVYYDFAWDGDVHPPTDFARRMGIDYFHKVVGVECFANSLGPLERLGRLSWVHVNRGRVDCEKLRYVEVEILLLTECNLANAEALRQCKGLTTLDLSYSDVSDIGVVSAIVGLQYLSLQGTQVTELNGLARLHQLQELDVSGTAVRNFEVISKLPALRVIHAYGCPAPKDEIARLRSRFPDVEINTH